MQVLGIDVDGALLDRWCDWLMPTLQPFAVPRELADAHGWDDARDDMTFEVRDSFEHYSIPDGHAIVMLSKDDMPLVPRRVRKAQPTPHYWPLGRRLDGRFAPVDRSRAIEYVEDGRRPSRHGEVGDDWSMVEGVLPGAEAIAGTFPDRSGPNCFGAVMAAAGVEGAAGEWMQREPFEEWLATATRPGGSDADPGTVLVWRTADGAVDHAAVTIGGGRLLHKPSQGWMSPTKVLAVRDGKLSARAPGRRLTRRRIV